MYVTSTWKMAHLMPKTKQRNNLVMLVLDLVICNIKNILLHQCYGVNVDQVDITEKNN